MSGIEPDPGRMWHADPGPSDGVWLFVYGTDYNDYPIAAFPNEVDARRFSDEKGYGYVTFWPYGVEWTYHQKLGRYA